MPFQPGNSGHPEGQRRAKLFAEALRMEIAAAGDELKALRRVARALLEEGYKGNIAAIAIIADRLDGKVPQPVGGSGELGPQRLHISWGDPTPEPVNERRMVIPTEERAVAIPSEDATGDASVSRLPNECIV